MGKPSGGLARLGAAGGDLRVVRVVTPPRTYLPVGRCIYCGTTEGPLDREHIVPFGLGGNLVLPASSCRACSGTTSAFEMSCLRAYLGKFRLRFGFPSRKGKFRPEDSIFKTTDGFGNQGHFALPPEKSPRILTFFRLQTAGLLSGVPASSSFEPEPVVIYHGDDRWAFETTWDVGEYTHADFCRLLAKIGHSYAIGDQGYDVVSQYEMLLPDLILGRRSDFGNLIGGYPADPPAEKSQAFELQVVRGEQGGFEFILVDVRLFGFMGTPKYHVVVGRRLLAAQR